MSSSVGGYIKYDESWTVPRPIKSPVGNIKYLGRSHAAMMTSFTSRRIDKGAWPNQYRINPGPNLCTYLSAWGSTSKFNKKEIGIMFRKIHVE